MKRTYILIAIGVIGILIILYRAFGFGASTGTEMESPTSDVATEILPADALLYFTAAGCASLPYVSALDENGGERVPLEPFPATDGYDYAAIEGTRETRTMLSRFTGECEETSPAPLDSFQALEVGITGSAEETVLPDLAE